MARVSSRPMTFKSDLGMVGAAGAWSPSPFPTSAPRVLTFLGHQGSRSSSPSLPTEQGSQSPSKSALHSAGKRFRMPWEVITKEAPVRHAAQETDSWSCSCPACAEKKASSSMSQPVPSRPVPLPSSAVPASYRNLDLPDRPPTPPRPSSSPRSPLYFSSLDRTSPKARLGGGLLSAIQGRAMVKHNTPAVAQVTDVEDGNSSYTDAGSYVEKPSGRSKCAWCCKMLSALLFLGAVIIGVLVWQKVIWFTVPSADYVADRSIVLLSGMGGNFEPTFTVKVAVKVANTNKYPLYFKDVELKVYDYSDNYLGTIKHSPTVKVEGRGSRTFEVEGKLTASPTEVAALGANCVANKMKTKARAEGSVKGVLGGLAIPIKLGPYDTEVKCTIV